MELRKFFREITFWDFLIIISTGFFLLNGLFYVFYTETFFDEGNFLYKSYLYTSGILKPYTPNSTWAEYMPGGYYLFGISQIFFGKSFYVARLLSLFFGFLDFFLCYLITKKISGKIGGVLSLIFIVTNITIVRCFSSIIVYSIVAFLVLLVLWVLLSKMKLILKTLFSLLLMFSAVFFRSSMLPSYVLMSVIWMIFQRKNPRNLFLTIFLTVLIPIFMLFPFMPGINHVFLQLPIIRSIAVRLGYPSIYFPSINQVEIMKVILSILEFIKYYQTWFILLFSIVIIFIFSSNRKRYLTIFKKSLGKYYQIFLFIVVFFVFNIVVHFVGAYGHCPKCTIGYFNYYSVLGAIILGSCFGILLKFVKEKLVQELLPVVFGFYVFYVGSATLYNITLINFNNTSLQKAEKVASNIKTLTKGADKIFLISEPHYLYLSERNGFGPLINIEYGFRSSSDSVTLGKVGYWNVEMAEKWLDEADWVIADEDSFVSLRNRGERLYNTVDSKIKNSYFLFKNYKDAWPASLSLYKKRVD